MTVPIPGAFFKPNLMLELSDGNVGTGCRVTDSSFIVTTLATHSYLFSPGCSSGVSMMRRGEGSGAGKLFLWPQSGWSSSAFVLLPRLPQAFRWQYWLIPECLLEAPRLIQESGHEGLLTNPPFPAAKWSRAGRRVRNIKHVLSETDRFGLVSQHGKIEYFRRQTDSMNRARVEFTGD